MKTDDWMTCFRRNILSIVLSEASAARVDDPAEILARDIVFRGISVHKNYRARFPSKRQDRMMENVQIGKQISPDRKSTRYSNNREPE